MENMRELQWIWQIRHFQKAVNMTVKLVITSKKHISMHKPRYVPHNKISNSVAALENLDDEVDLNRVWETIWENIQISAKDSLGYYELRKHEQWFNE
jgi:hypothetical protein